MSKVTVDTGVNIIENKEIVMDVINDYDVRTFSYPNIIKEVIIKQRIDIMYITYPTWNNITKKIEYAIWDLNDMNNFHYKKAHRWDHENVPKTHLRICFFIKHYEDTVFGYCWRMMYMYSPDRSIGVRVDYDYIYTEIPVDEHIKNSTNYQFTYPPLCAFL